MIKLMRFVPGVTDEIELINLTGPRPFSKLIKLEGRYYFDPLLLNVSTFTRLFELKLIESCSDLSKETLAKINVVLNF